VWELVQSLLLHYVKGREFKETKLSIFGRILGLLVPGVSAHSPVNYINAIRLGPATLNPTMSTTPHSKAMVTKDREDKALSDLDITIQQHVKCIQKWHRGQATKSTVDCADFVSGPPITL
jgi:hypothetical protein